jgi:hypothetical protein
LFVSLFLTVGVVSTSCHPRGLVSRDTQLENFIQTFRDTGWSDEEVNLIKEDAKQLKQESCGLQHIQCSSKLVFLDKFLTQLHSENMEFCENYRVRLYRQSNTCSS